MAEYIDRESLISNLKEFANKQLTPLIENLIQKQPTADVAEVRHGKWDYEDSDLGWTDYSCSVCRNIITTSANEDELYNCCPYCGARMDGETR